MKLRLLISLFTCQNVQGIRPTTPLLPIYRRRYNASGVRRRKAHALGLIETRFTGTRVLGQHHTVIHFEATDSATETSLSGVWFSICALDVLGRILRLSLHQLGNIALICASISDFRGSVRAKDRIWIPHAGLSAVRRDLRRFSGYCLGLFDAVYKLWTD